VVAVPPWLESHADLRDHPKTDLLMDLLAITRRDACGLLHFLWWRTLTYAPSGDLSDFTDGQIARWADWDGDPGHLVSALKTAGFMDSARTIHDWEDFAGRWIDRRNADADRKREARKAAAGRTNGSTNGSAAPDVRAASDGRPARAYAGARARKPDLTGPDHTGPNRTSTSPQPPPPAEGELAPTTEGDQKLWLRAFGEITDGMLPANVEKVAALEPLGRGSDGGLRLRAPPWADAGRFQGAVRASLVNAGDAAGGKATIVTG
jgi:hypothetical protein